MRVLFLLFLAPHITTAKLFIFFFVLLCVWIYFSIECNTQSPRRYV